MRNKLSVFVDGSFKENKAGVGIVIKRNHSVIRQERFRLTNCTAPHQAEKVAVMVGVEAVKKSGYSPKRSAVYTDCLSVVNQLNGELDGIRVVWVPREANEAHGMSVIGRTMTWWTTQKYRNFKKLNALTYLSERTD